MTKEYTDEKLAELAYRIQTGIEQSEAFERETDDLAVSIAERLIRIGQCNEPYMGVDYLWGLTKQSFEGLPIVTVMCYDTAKLKIVGPLKYRPLLARMPYVKELTELQNVAEAVRSVLMHKNGTENISEEDDDGI